MAYFRKPGGRRLMVDQSSRERIRTITIAPVGLEGLLGLPQDPKPGKPEPYRIRCSPETPGAGGEVEAAADGPLSRAPFRRALVL